MDETGSDMDNSPVPAFHRVDPISSTSRADRQKGEGFPGQRIVVLPRAVIRDALSQPLLRGLLGTDIGFFPRAQGHRRVRLTGSEQTIFIYCTHGRGWCELDDSMVEIGSGDLLVIPAGSTHAYGATTKAPWTIHWFHAAGHDVPDFQRQLGINRANPSVRMGHDPRALGLFEEALDTLEHGYLPTQLLYASQTLRHFLARATWLVRHAPRDLPAAAQRITRSVEFMKENLDRPLRASTLAAVAGLSVSQFAARFREVTGYPPVDYFNRLRMHRACQWLDTSDLSVKEIANRLGYDDPLYFSRAFKAVMELAPSEYRRVRKG